MKTKKPVVGFFGITGCAGCLLSFVFNETELVGALDLVDLKAFPFIKEDNDAKHFDVIFMEGLVASNDDIKALKDARKKCDTLVALGTCACTGGVPAMRNFVPKKQCKRLFFEKLKNIKDVKPTPIDSHVKVDFFIPGCPSDTKHVYKFIKEIIKHKFPKEYDNPVCVECKLNQNHCLLDEHKPCMGPVTKGGCDSICPNGEFECWGCRGPTSDANYKVMVELLEGKGLYNIDHVKERIRSFSGLKVPEFDKYLKDKKEKK